MKHALCLSLAALLWPSIPLQAAPPAKEELVDQVRKAIEDGKKFLRQQQVVFRDGAGDWTGHWEVDVNCKAHHGGWTSLAILALLSAGEKPDAPVMQLGLKFLREISPQKTYCVGLQTMVFVEAGDPQDRARIQRNVDWLVKTRVHNGGQFLGWGYEAASISADNSNTQYAVLGLSAGKHAGAKIDPKTWEAIRTFYIRTQRPDGDWCYRDNVLTASLTMTVAGLCGLYLAGPELDAAQQQLQLNGVALKCGMREENAAIVKATDFLNKNHTIDKARLARFYHLGGLERVGRLSGQRFFGDHDWYREGCQYLVTNQRDDGSWYLRGEVFDSWPTISTSYGLIFLAKGRTPVLISKLTHGRQANAGSDWNRKLSDLRNLTAYASNELFKKQPLTWQIFNARDVKPEKDEEIAALVSELLQSPIAYLSGHNAPLLEPWEKRLIKQYLDKGGFLLAEACCGAKDFDKGFRELMKELFPDAPLKRLPADHAVWSTHAKVSADEFALEGFAIGKRTAVIYSPQPLSGWWESNDFEKGRGQLAFRLGANIIAHATAGEMPLPKGAAVLERRPKAQ